MLLEAPVLTRLNVTLPSPDAALCLVARVFCSTRSQPIVMLPSRTSKFPEEVNSKTILKRQRDIGKMKKLLSQDNSFKCAQRHLEVNSCTNPYNYKLL